MLEECIQIFQEKLEAEGLERLILDSYIPADGTYVILQEQEGTWKVKEEPAVIKYDKKNKELLGQTHSDFQLFKKLDYYSKLIDMNKPIDGKKIIQSNQYCAFFIKKESLQNGKLTNEIIDGYYQVLLNPEEKYSRPKAKLLYQKVEEMLPPMEEEKVERVRQWIKENIFSLEKYKIPLEGRDYLKIFFLFGTKTEALERFEREGKRYLLPNIYNNNDYNVFVDDKVYGVPNNNMGLNAKKPFLEHRTRTMTVPYLVDYEQIGKHKEFFDYLYNFAVVGKVNLYVDCDRKEFIACENSQIPKEKIDGYFLRLRKGKEVEIHNMDCISGFDPYLEKPFQYQNIIQLKLHEKEEVPPYCIMKTREKLEEEVNRLFFSKCLVANYFTDPKDMSVKDSTLSQCILISREILFHWFRKGNDQGVEAVLEKVAITLIKSNFQKEYGRKAAHQFNLWIAIKDYFAKGEEKMGKKIVELKDRLREKINAKETEDILEDNEFYFAIGQIITYFLSNNKSGKKNYALINPYLNANDVGVLKSRLVADFKKYSYAIEIKGKRFPNLLAMLMAYQPEGKVNQEMLLAGIMCTNLIYEKTEEEKENE